MPRAFVVQKGEKTFSRISGASHVHCPAPSEHRTGARLRESVWPKGDLRFFSCSVSAFGRIRDQMRPASASGPSSPRIFGNWQVILFPPPRRPLTLICYAQARARALPACEYPRLIFKFRRMRKRVDLGDDLVEAIDFLTTI